jgi:hypothetical protein
MGNFGGGDSDFWLKEGVDVARMKQISEEMKAGLSLRVILILLCVMLADCGTLVKYRRIPSRSAIFRAPRQQFCLVAPKKM